MAISSGPHTLGPGTGTLTVRTKKTGAAAKAGHNLLIEVTAWEATLEADAAGVPTTMELTADPRSLRVREGTGGIHKLGDEEKDSIRQSIDDDVLEGRAISFRSASVAAAGDSFHVEGELELGGQRNPIAFDVAIDDGGRLSGHATVVQSGWGIQPFSILFGTLKVVDEVRVEIDAQLPAG
jgi:polyisoprenoid-binding protein YceI